MRCTFFIALSTASLVSISARAATYVVGSDARPNIVNGRIVTDAYDDATAAFQSNVKVFSYQVGLTPNNPYFTSDPGFNATVNSGLPQGQQLRFDIVRHLSLWNGASGPVQFLGVPNSESLRLSLGTAQSIVTGWSDAVPGFSLGNIGASGVIHKHLNATLRGGIDNLADPSTGLYFTALRLSVSDGSAIHSDALYIAYDVGLTDADFQRGMNYLANPIAGDANFDGVVNFSDLVVLAQHYGSTDASFFDGDFNSDRNVDFKDLVALAQNYNTSATTFVSDLGRAETITGIALPSVQLPEPIATSSLLIPILFAGRARRRVTFNV